MPISYPIPDELRQMWQSVAGPVHSVTKPIDAAMSWPMESSGLLSGMMPESPEAGYDSGMLNMTPGMIAANFRSPQQIQQLRKVMAEEMRSRGPAVQATVGQRTPYTPENIEAMFSDKELPAHLGRRSEAGFDPEFSDLGYKTTDPFDQILRGTPYHGLSDNARRNVVELVRKEDPILAREFGGMLSPDELALRGANEVGFPISLHNAQSISNKLGEPAGVSLSFLPTKSKDFAKDRFGNQDEYIHRVLPLYGGPPTQRVANLMAPEGRMALNDAYDVAANQLISPVDFHQIARQFKFSPPSMMSPEYVEKTIQRGLEEGLSTGHSGVGSFNKALSEQLQSQGYRGLLYNPQRWNEYEMLMLDPKYALPLDYRMFQEYANPAWKRSKGVYKNGGDLDLASATPGVQKGLSQIQDVMSQNKSRLGDIYQERPWTQRLSDENKQKLLEMIEPPYREQIGNQLSGRGKPYEVQSGSTVESIMSDPALKELDAYLAKTKSSIMQQKLDAAMEILKMKKGEKNFALGELDMVGVSDMEFKDWLNKSFKK